MQVAEVQRGVEERLGLAVSRGSVYACLSVGARDSVRFERVATGCYRLVPGR